MAVESVVSGNGLLTSEIQSFCVELLMGVVPKKWETLWSGCDDTNEWIKSFGKKIYQLKKWVEYASSSNLVSQ